MSLGTINSKQVRQIIREYIESPAGQALLAAIIKSAVVALSAKPEPPAQAAAKKAKKPTPDAPAAAKKKAAKKKS